MPKVKNSTNPQFENAVEKILAFKVPPRKTKKRKPRKQGKEN